MFSSKEKRFFTTNSHGPVAEAYLQTGSHGRVTQSRLSPSTQVTVLLGFQAKHRDERVRPPQPDPPDLGRPTELGGCN